MEVTTSKGTVSIDDESALLDYLQSVRQGDFGAFFLNRGHSECLAILINRDVAFLTFFPDNQGLHPGFQSTGMTPKGLEGSVWFEQTHSGSGFDIASEFVVPLDVAYAAAVDYFRKPGRPASVNWYDLVGP